MRTSNSHLRSNNLKYASEGKRAKFSEIYFVPCVKAFSDYSFQAEDLENIVTDEIDACRLRF